MMRIDRTFDSGMRHAMRETLQGDPLKKQAFQWLIQGLSSRTTLREVNQYLVGKIQAELTLQGPDSSTVARIYADLWETLHSMFISENTER